MKLKIYDAYKPSSGGFLKQIHSRTDPDRVNG